VEFVEFFRQCDAKTETEEVLSCCRNLLMDGFFNHASIEFFEDF
jgi:hypothetical protein